MNYYNDVSVLNLKLKKILTPHNLLHEFNKEKYPVTLTIKQNQTPDAQMAIYENAEGSVSSCDAVLRFIFKLEGLEVQTDSRLVISDELFNKIKNIAKKLHAAYTAAYFAERRDPEAMKLYGDPDAPAKNSDAPYEE